MGFPKLDFSKRLPSGFGLRPMEGSAMKSGSVAHALFLALQDKRQKDGLSAKSAQAAAGIGMSTWQALRSGKAIRATTAQSICRYLGTDLRNVLDRYAPSLGA